MFRSDPRADARSRARVGAVPASFGRAPHCAEFLSETATIAQGVVVGDGDWSARLAANKQAFFDHWTRRSDFRAVYDGLSNAAYVDKLIGYASGFNGDRGAIVNSLNGGTISRTQALRSIAENEGFTQAKRNATFVMMQYFGYLRREPDADGYQYWLNKLNQFGGNFEQAEMVRSFLVSAEYRNRFVQ